MTEKTKRLPMMQQVKKDYPHMFTKDGRFRKVAPKKYKCERCGDTFNKAKTVNLGGLGFAVAECSLCGGKGRHRTEHMIWERHQYGQIEVEEFILDTVIENPKIEVDVIRGLIREKFGNSPYHYDRGLGHLVYHGYLNLDPELREAGHTAYVVNPEKNLSKRYEKMT